MVDVVESKEGLAEKYPTTFAVPYHQGHVLFYTQSQSKRAWATFVSPVKQTPGQEYDNSTLKIFVPLPETVNTEEPLKITVTLNLFEKTEEYQEALKETNSQNLTLLQEVIFKNPYLKDPFTLSLGYYQTEVYKETFVDTKFVHVTSGVDNLTHPTQIVLLLNLIKGYPSSVG